MKKLLLLVGISLIMSCQNSIENKRIDGSAFGTYYSIIYSGSLDQDKTITAMDSIITAFNNSVSTYHPHSIISRINQGDSSVVVDTIFKHTFLMSKEIHKKTNGYFDPTIGVLRNAYGFGDTQPIQHIDESSLDSLMQMVGFDKVSLQEDGTIHKTHPNTYIDFNAIAKGYGVDEFARYLDSQGVSNYLIEIGGEMVARGINREKNNPWMVGIENINSELEDRTYHQIIPLQNVGLAASGNYRKFRIDEETGDKYVHTIDPLTGSAEQSDLTSATVLARTCAEADAYATAFMALGIEKSKELLKELEGVEAYFTYISEDDHKDYATPAMKLLFQE